MFVKADVQLIIEKTVTVVHELPYGTPPELWHQMIRDRELRALGNTLPDRFPGYCDVAILSIEPDRSQHHEGAQDRDSENLVVTRHPGHISPGPTR